MYDAWWWIALEAAQKSNDKQLLDNILTTIGKRRFSRQQLVELRSFFPHKLRRVCGHVWALANRHNWIVSRDTHTGWIRASTMGRDEKELMAFKVAYCVEIFWTHDDRFVVVQGCKKSWFHSVAKRGAREFYVETDERIRRHTLQVSPFGPHMCHTSGATPEHRLHCWTKRKTTVLLIDPEWTLDMRLYGWSPCGMRVVVLSLRQIRVFSTDDGRLLNVASRLNFSGWQLPLALQDGAVFGAFKLLSPNVVADFDTGRVLYQNTTERHFSQVKGTSRSFCVEHWIGSGGDKRYFIAFCTVGVAQQEHEPVWIEALLYRPFPVWSHDGAQCCVVFPMRERTNIRWTHDNKFVVFLHQHEWYILEAKALKPLGPFWVLPPGLFHVMANE